MTAMSIFWGRLRMGSRPDWLMAGFAVVFIIIGLRAFGVQIIHRDFFQQQGANRYERLLTLPAPRGMLTDRNGEVLAVSTPVDSIWINPQQLDLTQPQCVDLARLAGLSMEELITLVKSNGNRQFVYLKRHINPADAQAFIALGLAGVATEREYRRYYPTADIAAHMIGFTNVDGKGQEGLERALDAHLAGVAGKQRIWKDLSGRVIEVFPPEQLPQAGQSIQLSIDRRIQYFAYRELQNAIAEHHPLSASVVIVDAMSSEVLAMVNHPGYNPNDRNQLKPELFRNRAVTDVLEPGSTIKPFTVAAGLKSGLFKPDSVFDTNPGYFTVGRLLVKDHRNYGVMDLATALHKSSNIVAARIALAIEPALHWQLLADLGFGRLGESGFPGERSGFLPHYETWGQVQRATLAYGYGLSVTPLQLAQAYAALASDGQLRPITFLKVDDQKALVGKPVLDPYQAQQIRWMLEGVTTAAGTAKKAAVEGYRVAGKTGTAYKASAGGYDRKRYMSIFAGFAPVTKPKVVMVVVINEPQGELYYGGDVAAPVFSKVMEGTLRLLNIPPDALEQLPIQLSPRVKLP